MARLKKHVPDANIIKYPLAGHYVFLTREQDVLREIHTFVAAVRGKPR